ncbi:MAG: DegQ family serine endoprotease [Candidatus Tectomicrobia bacterium]|nr:DegQ family serine endoprotease [Candidatus Tectomicrobia bacterium]
MFHQVKHSLSHTGLGKRALVVTALSFFLMGLVIASGLQWTGSAVAENTPTARPAMPTMPMRPPSFADLAKQLSPTVVNIKVTKVQNVSGLDQLPQQLDPDGPFGEFFKRFFKDMPQSPHRRQQQGAGSGVIISEDGYIVSNNHVVENAEAVTVTLADQQEYEAKIMGRDPKTDLAVLKIEPKFTLPAAKLGNSDDLNVGDWVLAIGNPFGLNHTVTSGIVSAKGRVIGAGPYDDFIQTDASINPGNSGGPLFNMNGDVVGINTAIIPNGQGIGFAIPVNTAKPLIPQLMSDGTVTRGFLGVNIQTITPELAAALKLQDRNGALVSDVMPDSPAEQAGIQRGDVILTFNDKKIEDSRDLAATVAGTPVDEDVEVLVLRDGKQTLLPLTVGKMMPDGDAKQPQTQEPERSKWGFRLQELTPEMARKYGLSEDQGVGVVAVQPDSPAAEAGVRPGDILLQVNQKPVQSLQDVQDALAQADEDALLILVKRNQGSLFIALAK